MGKSKSKKGNKKFVLFNATKTDNTKENNVQTQTDKKNANQADLANSEQQLKSLQIQATTSKQSTEQGDILNDKTVEKIDQALGELPCDVTSQPVQISGKGNVNENLPKNLEKSELALGEKPGGDVTSRRVQRSIGNRENHRNLGKEKVNDDQPTQRKNIEGSEKMDCEKHNLRYEKAKYKTELPQNESDRWKRVPIDSRCVQDFNQSNRDKRNLENTDGDSTNTHKSHYRGDTSDCKTFSKSRSQPNYDNTQSHGYNSKNHRDSNQSYPSRNNRDYSDANRRENNNRSGNDRQYNSGSRNFGNSTNRIEGNRRNENNSTYKNKTSDSSKQHDHTVDHSWAQDPYPSHDHTVDHSWAQDPYPSDKSQQHDHKYDTSSDAHSSSKDTYPSNYDHQHYQSYTDQESHHTDQKRVASSNIDTTWITNVSSKGAVQKIDSDFTKPSQVNLNKSSDQDQPRDTMGQGDDLWFDTSLGSQQCDNQNNSTISWRTETILESHSDQNSENVTEAARRKSILNVNAEAFVPSGPKTKGVQNISSNVGVPPSYQGTFSDVNDESRSGHDQKIIKHKYDKLHVPSEEIKEPLRPSKTSGNLDNWLTFSKKEQKCRKKDQRGDIREKQSDENLSTNKSSRFDNLGRNFDYKRRNSRDFTDNEYQEYKKDFAKNPDFCKVKEIEQDLFAMSKDYSLAHCVAEDLRMGSGIAVQFKREFKELGCLLNQKQKQGGLAVLHDEKNNRYIYYLVTKRDSTGKPTYETMWKSLQKLRDHIRDNNVPKLALPRLGCGLDRLEWSDVKAFIAFLFKDVDVEIVVCNFQQNLDDSNGIPPKDRSCKVVTTYDKHISVIESGTTILYFTSEDNQITAEMKALDKKFFIKKDFNAKSQKKMGDLIKTDHQRGTYILYGCVVKGKQDEEFDFLQFERCIWQINKNNKVDQHYYVAFQAQKSEQDSLLTEKLITIARNCLRNVDVYVCHKELDISSDVKK